MDLRDYLAATDLTARYPGAGTGSTAALTYLGLGLAGESSEVLEKVLAGDRDGARAELGDVLWYVARLCREYGLPVDQLQPESPAPAPVAPSVPVIGQLVVVAQMVVQAGRVAEVVKKVVRDDGQHVTPERVAALAELLGSVQTSWRAAVSQLGLDPAAVAARNIDKLLDRRDRGVLAGSGDHR